MLTSLFTSLFFSFFDVSSINTVYYMAPFATMILSLPAMLLEGNGVLDWFQTHPYAWSSLFIIFGSGVLAFCLNFSIFYVIHSTTAVTFNVAGNLKVSCWEDSDPLFSFFVSLWFYLYNMSVVRMILFILFGSKSIRSLRHWAFLGWFPFILPVLLNPCLISKNTCFLVCSLDIIVLYFRKSQGRIKTISCLVMPQCWACC